jgi:hypothetical protein
MPIELAAYFRSRGFNLLFGGCCHSGSLVLDVPSCGDQKSPPALQGAGGGKRKNGGEEEALLAGTEKKNIES